MNVRDASTRYESNAHEHQLRLYRSMKDEERAGLALQMSDDVRRITVLAKLEWAKLGESERRLRDVRGTLDVKADALDRAYIERWLDDLGVRDLWDRVGAM